MLKEITENQEAIKTLVRPVISIILVIGWVVMLIMQVEVHWLYPIATVLMILCYAGERAFKRLREMMGYKNGGGDAK